MSPSIRRLIRLGAAIVLIAILGPHTAAQNPAAQDPMDDPPASADSVEPGQSGDGARQKLETFEPTEQVSADSAVTFPVDI